MINYMTRRLNKIEQILNDKDKQDKKILFITLENREEHSNDNKKYYIKGNCLKIIRPDADIEDNTELIYDNLDDFYKEFNINPKGNIHIIIMDVIDTTETEKAFWSDTTD